LYYSLTSLVLALSATPSTHGAEPIVTERIVVTGTYTPIKRLNASSNIDLISQEEIERVMAVTPADILNRITGVHIQTNSGMESLPAMRSPVLTGPGAAGAFIFAQDGIATRASGFANNNGLSELNLSAASGIEVIRGPASAIYGSNAVHGVVNVLSANVDMPNRLGVLVGENDHINVAAKYSTEKFAIDYQHVNDNGFREQSGFVNNKLDTKYVTQVDQAKVSTTFSAFSINQDTAGFISSGDNGDCFVSSFAAAYLYKDDHAMSQNCDPDAYRDWSGVRFASQWLWLLDNNAELSITPYYRNNQMEFRQHYLPSRAVEENSHSSLGLKSVYRQTFKENMKIAIGVDLENTSGTLVETQDIPDRFSFGKARQQGQHFNYEVKARVIAPFVQLTYQATDALVFDTSVRFDSTSYDYDNFIADGTNKADGSSCTQADGSAVECLFLRPSDRNDDFNNTSVKAGVNYMLAEQSAIFASLASGFRAPQTTDLYRLQNQQTIGEIDSESTDSFEIGYRHQGQTLAYEFVWYIMKKDNFFFRDSAGLNVTDGQTSHTGLELSLDYHISKTLKLRANYSVAEHTYDFDRANSGVIKGNEIDTAPSQMGNMQIAWTPNDIFSLEIEWLTMGDYFVDPANAHSYAGHNLVHARTAFAISKNMTITANIENISDERYASRADFAFGSYRFFGGQPRNVKLGLKVTF
jgi:iron complex outermembrane receptor protein